MSSQRSNPDFLTVGRIVSPRGLNGDLKVRLLTGDTQGLQERKTVFVGDPPKPFAIESVRLRQGRAILKLAAIRTRKQAEALRQCVLSIPLEEATPLKEDEYYVFQVLGLSVYTDQGKYLGNVSDVIFTGSNEVYVVKGAKRDILVPAIADVVQKVDLEKEHLIITPPEGLL